MTTTRMTGAMYIAHCLQKEGVTKVFGQCGHTNYGLIDSCDRLGIEYVSFRHEQQAVHGPMPTTASPASSPSSTSTCRRA